MTFDAAEKHQSQIPALQLLVALGFTPLSQAEAVRLRAGRLRNVVLDDILADQLLRINSFSYRGGEYPFDLEDAHEAIPTAASTNYCRGPIQHGQPSATWPEDDAYSEAVCGFAKLIRSIRDGARSMRASSSS